MNPFDRLSTLYHDRASAARAWRAAGGTVVGYFSDDVPTALIEAAGFLAYRISGDPDGGHPAVMARGPLDVRADRLAFVNSWVHLIASGRYDFIDHFIVGNARKYILQLHERLGALARPPSVHVLDRALGDGPAAHAFNRRQVTKLRSALEAWSGTPIAENKLVDAIVRRNRIAGAVHRAAALREGAIVRMTGVQALHLFGALRFMHSTDSLPLAEEAIAAADAATPLEGTRLFVSGSPLDHDDVYAAIEGAGFVVTGESHRWGPRALEIAIDDGDPWQAVADHYHACADFVVPLDASVRETADHFQRSGAQAAFAYVFAYDDASLWEAPSELAAIDAPGVLLAEQPYRADAAAIGSALAQLNGEVAA